MTRRTPLRIQLLAAAGLLALLAGPVLATEDCGWSSGFEVLGLDKPVYAWTVYDDGSGPALYAGGWFINANGKPVNNVARWDGKSWKPLGGPLGKGTDGVVYALAVYDDGNGEALYAGGAFTTAGGVPARYVARWDGHAWAALTGAQASLSGPVNAFAVYDDGDGPALFAGGFFQQAGQKTANHLARWDGDSWSVLKAASGVGVGGGQSDKVLALQVHDDGNGEALFLGGFFSTAGGIEAHNVARWDGTRFSALPGFSGDGTDNGVRALTVFDDGNGDALFLGGLFLYAGGQPASHLARWDGTALSKAGNISTGGSVYALAVFDDGNGDALYIGGSVLNRWDGQQTAYLAGPAGVGPDVTFLVTSLGVFDDGRGPALYLGGDFSRVDTELANHAARWNGATFLAVGRAGVPGPGPGGLNAMAKAFAVFDGGPGKSLYVGGDFTTAGGRSADGIVRWDGTHFSALYGPSGSGVHGPGAFVDALAVYDDGGGPDLYVGGQFQQAGGVEANNIARWDGRQFSALTAPGGNGTNFLVEALAVYDGDLYVAGGFNQAGGVPVEQLARWNGSSFEAIPGATDISSLQAMAVFDDGAGPVLYVAGIFGDGNGGILDGLARWDGTTFMKPSAAAGLTTDDRIKALQVFDDALYVGGRFTRAGGVSSPHLARWDGAAFSAVGLDLGTVEALAVHDDGTGPALYAGGLFPTGVVRWDGVGFSSLAGPAGDGVDGGFVEALASYDGGTGPALYAGGSFVTAGGIQSSHFGRWGCDGAVAIAEPLVLHGGRFEVTVTWTDPAGTTGTGHPVRLTEKSGYFYFYGHNNVELVVKVLDGCDSNDRFWVFAAGLTNLGVEMTVTDTVAGVKKVYKNPVGTAFPPIQDTQTFATCGAAP